MSVLNTYNPSPEPVNLILGDSLYTHVEGPTWEEAQANARAFGGDLVTINNQEENIWITQNIKSLSEEDESKYWIGLENDRSANEWQNQNWEWISGDKSEYRFWHKDEPWIGDKEPYAFINIPEERVDYENNIGVWVPFGSYTDYETGVFHGVGTGLGIAEIPFIRRDDSAYVIVEGPTWEEAEANANALGGHLVTINDAEENQWIATEFSKSKYYYDGDSSINDHTHFWLGASDDAKEGSWEWASGQEWTFDGFSREHSVMPLPNNGGDHLVGIFNVVSGGGVIHGEGPGTFYWDDYEITHQSFKGIAEIPLHTNNRPAEASAAKAAFSQAVAGSLSGSISGGEDVNVVLSTDIYSVSAAEAGDLSQALTFNDGSQALGSYIETNGPVSTETILNNSEAKIFAVKQENAADGDNFYVLDVDAKASGNYNLNSYDISLSYDKNLFDLLDVGVNGKFNFFNSAAIDSDNGTVRVVGGSAENLGDGLGGGTADGNTFQLLLKSIHNDDHNSTESVNAAFRAKVNSTDTVLVDGEDFIKGTSDLLTSDYTFANSFVDFKATNNIAFATERSIGITGGDQKYTSILREGSDLDSLGTFNLSTLGNITAAYQASIKQSATNIYTIDFIEGASVDLDKVEGNASHIEGSTNNYQLRLSVEGTAGNIIDLSETTIMVSDQADTSKYAETSVLAGKNLITYQSDINYDGRVSMMDLAYLNAGAGNTNGASIEDVDVNYDKTIDLKDLEMMDDQWGNSLHTEKLIVNDIFTGNNGTINLKEISIADNSSFIAQNDFENPASEFVDTLADAGSAGYSETDFSGDYGDIYDAVNNAVDPV